MVLLNIKELQEELIEYSKEIGIDKIGFASVDTFSELKARLIRQRELGYDSGFEEPDIEKRVSPTLLLPGAASIISIALAYPSKMKNPPRSKRGERRGIFCRASWGKDYHLVLQNRLKKLELFLRDKVPNVSFTSMVDTGELSDRAVAERAGIGWSGKNCSIITQEFGSYVYLGELITNIPFLPSTPIEDQCGDCRKCLDACPTNALVGPGQLNAKKCIAFLTQTKEMIPIEYRKKIGNRIYGCDTCQIVCPKNKGIDSHNHLEMEPDPEVAKPLLLPLLKLSNRQFKERYGEIAGSWRGKNPIQRNAVIALGHFKEVQAIPDLVELISRDPRPVIRGTAVWALGEIVGEEIVSYIGDIMGKETDEQVLHEYEMVTKQEKE